MATRDLSYLIDFNVEGSGELATAAEDMEKLADATTGIGEQDSLDFALPQAEEIDAVGTSLGELGVDGGPMDKATEKAGGVSGAFQTMVGAIGLVQVGAEAADFVMGRITERLDFIAETEAWDAGRVQTYADALGEVTSDVEAIADVIRQLADEPIQDTTGLFGLGGGVEIPNIAAALGAFGITAEEVLAVISGGAPELEAFEQRLDEVGASGSFGSQVMGVLAGEQQAAAEATATHTAENLFFAESQESANRALQELLTQRDPMSQFTDEWDLLKESMADGSIDTGAAAVALNTLSTGLGLTTEEVLKLAQADLDEAAVGALAFADALNSIDFEAAELEGATTAFAAYTDQLFAAGNEAERRESAFDALSAAAENQSLTFSAATEAGRAQSDALEGVARVLDEDLAEAYDNANGSQADFVAAATQIADQTLGRLQDELGLTDAQLQTVATALGLTEGDFIARYQLAGAEEARIQLGLLSGAIEGLPTDIEQTVTQQILAGDFVGARDTVANFYAENPVPLPTEADITGAEGDLADAVADPPTATIPTAADTAIASDDLLELVTAPRTATINVEAPAASAVDATLNAVAADRTATVDVRTGTVDVPTAGQIASRIGPVPVTLYGVWSTRIEGSRPR